jgi:hypothetical protein
LHSPRLVGNPTRLKRAPSEGEAVGPLINGICLVPGRDGPGGPGTCPRKSPRRARQGLRSRFNAERGGQAVHPQACYPGREATPGAVGIAQTGSVGAQEGVRTDRHRRLASSYWRDGRQDTRARHQGWRRQAQGRPRHARRGRARCRPLESAHCRSAQ